MRRGTWALSVMAAALLVAAPLRAEECAPSGAAPADKLAPSVLDPCFEGVTFGEARGRTLEHCAARVRSDYGVLMLAEKSAVEKDALKKRMDDDVAKLATNGTDFTGGATGFDASPLVSDFAKHADEGLFEVSKGTDRVYFLYSEDRLWKIVWVVDAASQSLDDLTKRVSDAYGKGTPSKADAKLTVWDSKVLRLELADQRPVFNAYVLRWTSKEHAAKVEAHRREKGAVVAAPAQLNLGEDDVLNQATGSGEKVDNVVDDILGQKPGAVPDVAGEAKAQKAEKDKAKGAVIKKKTKVLNQAPGPKPKGM